MAFKRKRYVRRRRPYRRYKRRTYRKRSKYEYPRNTLRLRRFPPENMLIKCRAVFKELFDVAAGTPFTDKQIFYRANSINDFKVEAGLAVRPVNYTLLSETYDHFTVVGSKVTFRLTNHDNAEAINVYVTGQDSGVAYGFEEDLRQQYDTKLISLGPSRGSGSTKRITQRFSMSKHLGSNDTSNSKTGAAFGSNPSEIWYYNLCCTHADPTTAATSRVTVEGSVVFWVLCTELQDNNV